MLEKVFLFIIFTQKSPYENVLKIMLFLGLFNPRDNVNDFKMSNVKNE
jgi:hypothetical protein